MSWEEKHRKTWREKNKDSIRAYSRAYYLAHKEENKASCRKWLAKNKDKTSAYQAKWYHGEAGQAYLARTAEKRSKQQLRRRALDPLKYIEMVRRSNKTPGGRARMVCYRNENRLKLRAGRYAWADKNPHKVKAARIVAVAIRNGRLCKEPCEKCGSVKDLRAAHNDYSRPFNVTWLCRDHHAERYRRVPGVVQRLKMFARSI